MGIPSRFSVDMIRIEGYVSLDEFKFIHRYCLVNHCKTYTNKRAQAYSVNAVYDDEDHNFWMGYGHNGKNSGYLSQKIEPFYGEVVDVRELVIEFNPNKNPLEGVLLNVLGLLNAFTIINNKELFVRGGDVAIDMLGVKPEDFILLKPRARKYSTICNSGAVTKYAGSRGYGRFKVYDKGMEVASKNIKEARRVYNGKPGDISDLPFNIDGVSKEDFDFLIRRYRADAKASDWCRAEYTLKLGIDISKRKELQVEGTLPELSIIDLHSIPDVKMQCYIYAIQMGFKKPSDFNSTNRSKDSIGKKIESYIAKHSVVRLDERIRPRLANTIISYLDTLDKTLFEYLDGYRKQIDNLWEEHVNFCQSYDFKHDDRTNIFPDTYVDDTDLEFNDDFDIDELGDDFE